MTSLQKSLIGVVAAAGLLALSGVNASAEIACVGPVCWHTPGRYDYPAEANVTYSSKRLAVGSHRNTTLGASTRAVVTGEVTVGWNGSGLHRA